MLRANKCTASRSATTLMIPNQSDGAVSSSCMVDIGVNIWPNWDPLPDISPFKVTQRSNVMVQLRLYEFLSLFDSNIWPNSAQLTSY